MKSENTTPVKSSRVLAAAMITAFMTTFMSSSLNLSIPALESYFGVSAAAVSWIISAYTISVASVSLPCGKIADITSRRTVFLIGVGGFGIFSFISIFSANITMLIILRVLAGICAGMIFSTNNALLISSYPHDVQGKMIGYSTAATYIGLTAGPVVGGILNSTLGWRSIFAVSVAVSAAAFIAGLSAARDGSGNARTDDDQSRSFDVRGTVLYIAAISLSLQGLTGLGTGVLPAAMFVTGLAALVFFYFNEKMTEDPIMKVSMFTGSRTFTFSNLAALLNYGATFAISYTISIYLQVVRGMPSSTAGLLLITMPAVQAVFSPLMGSLSDRVRPSVLASTGMGICALTLVLFSRVGEETPIIFVIAVLCLTGFGFALFSSPNMNAILNCVDKEDYGVANSIIATMRTYGQSSGMAVLSIITVAVLGSSSLAESPVSEILRMMHTAFLVFAAISVVGLFFSLARDSK